MGKARAMSKATSKRKLCEPTDAKWGIGAELLEPTERAMMTVGEREQKFVFFSTRLCFV